MVFTDGTGGTGGVERAEAFGTYSVPDSSEERDEESSGVVDRPGDKRYTESMEARGEAKLGSMEARGEAKLGGVFDGI